MLDIFWLPSILCLASIHIRGGVHIMYAIIESCGRQYKVSEGDVVFFEKLDAEEGKKLHLITLFLYLTIKKLKLDLHMLKV